MMSERRIRKAIATTLAHEMLAVPFTRPQLRRCASRVLGPLTVSAQMRLIGGILRRLQTGYPPRPDELIAALLAHPAFDRATARVKQRPDYIHPSLAHPRFAPLEKFATLDVPRMATTGDLAAWLRVDIDALDWLADARRQHGTTRIPILQHYKFAVIPKRSGAPRLLEEPKPRLKTIQRRILDEILAQVPVHDAAYAFVPWRSAVDAAAKHVGEEIVVSLDIADFFPATSPRRIHALFRSIGYPWTVARALTGLITTTTPSSVIERLSKNGGGPAAVHLYRRPHLPQGAPTSPAIANLCSWRLDCRLAGLAQRFDARYTRYADDMTFSGGGELSQRTGTLLRAVREIVADEGFVINQNKTRVMRRQRRQQVTGIVVNEQLNVPRTAFDALKATLHNAARLGWREANLAGHPDFRAHLDGRINWVEQLNPSRGAKLRARFHTIDWR